MIPPGDSLFKLAAKAKIKDLIESNEDLNAEVKALIESISLHY
jgi:hypothetical protein